MYYRGTCKYYTFLGKKHLFVDIKFHFEHIEVFWINPAPTCFQTAVVHVFPVKDQLPVEVSGSVRSLKVKETEVVYITQAHLHFTDREHPDTDLTYVITQPCFSPLHPG